MSKVVRRIRNVLLGLVCVIGVLLVAAFLAINSIVKSSINKAAPKLLGVNTRVETVSIRPFAGIIHLKVFDLNNPEGYAKDKKLFGVKEFYVNLDMGSLFTDTIVIHKILIIAPEFTYEVKNGKSNIDALVAQLNKGKPAPQKTEPNAAQKPQIAKKGKKVIIEEVTVQNTKLAYSSVVTAGTFVTIPIVSITLKDIGKENGGESFADAIVVIFDGILKSFTSAISGAGDLLGSAASAGLKGATDAAKASGEAVGAGLKGATDAAKASGDAVDAGVKETTKAVGSALDEVGGLFKSKKK